MEPIEGKTLDQLVTDASNELIGEKYRDGVTTVKKLLHAIHELAVDEKRLIIEAKKKQTQRTQKEELLNKIKGGDWAALEIKPQGENNA